MSTGLSERILHPRIPLVALLILSHLSPAVAQDPPQVPSRTVVEVEILIPAIGVNPLEAQRWGAALEEARIDASFKQPLPIDKPAVTEKNRGPLRIVRAVGRLNEDGTITFPGKKFSMSETRQFANWLKELEAFGALGSPTGQPQFGLSAAQYDDVLHQLAVPVSQSTAGLPLDQALARIPVPADYPLVFDEELSDRRVDFPAVTFPEELSGLSSGSALAFLLSQQRMAFMPLRTPEGKIHLHVYDQARLETPWPIGVKLPDDVTRDKVYPKLFEFVETGFNNASLPAVLDGVEKRADVRILADRAGCAAQGIDLDQIAISQPVKKTAWMLIITSAVAKPGLVLSQLQDESGRGFLLVEPFRVTPPKSTRDEDPPLLRRP